jgi:hypothetical protein
MSTGRIEMVAVTATTVELRLRHAADGFCVVTHGEWQKLVGVVDQMLTNQQATHKRETVITVADDQEDWDLA